MNEQPIWTEAEQNEIMRLHIVDALTISGAMRHVFDQRALGAEPPQDAVAALREGE